MTSHPLTNEAWYDVLYTFEYMKAFSYYPSTLPDRNECIPID